jgi:hypothetical protein
MDQSLDVLDRDQLCHLRVVHAWLTFAKRMAKPDRCAGFPSLRASVVGGACSFSSIGSSVTGADDEGKRCSVDELPREAFGVRPACWRCREVWGGPKAGASSTHSKRFAQFDCSFAVLCLKCRHEA